MNTANSNHTGASHRPKHARLTRGTSQNTSTTNDIRKSNFIRTYKKLHQFRKKCLSFLFARAVYLELSGSNLITRTKSSPVSTPEQDLKAVPIDLTHILTEIGVYSENFNLE